MTVFYMSLYGLFLLAPFILRTRLESAAAVSTIVVADHGGRGIGFLLFPARLAFTPVREEQLGVWAGMYHAADASTSPTTCCRRCTWPSP